MREKEKSTADLHMIPPDGKYGWIIVISYAIANVSEQNKSSFDSFVLFLFFQNFHF